jgi:putative DNA primase/helicase
VAKFPVYCPKLIAGIGELPDTVADRCIPIRLRAKAKSEHVERFLMRDVRPDADALRGQIAAWATEHLEQLADARPDMPGELSDRMVEGGEPLVAIGDLLGCGDAARSALVALCTAERLDASPSLGLRLLADTRTIWAERPRVRALHTPRLLAALHDIEEAPWGTYRGHDGLNARQLADLLRPYGVGPKSIRHKKTGKVYKGYERVELEALWERYL